jgi:hypothetical protein
LIERRVDSSKEVSIFGAFVSKMNVTASIITGRVIKCQLGVVPGEQSLISCQNLLRMQRGVIYYVPPSTQQNNLIEVFMPDGSGLFERNPANDLLNPESIELLNLSSCGASEAPTSWYNNQGATCAKDANPLLLVTFVVVVDQHVIIYLTASH